MTTFPYLPLDARGWKMAMGLRPLTWGTWLEVDERRDSELSLKQQLLTEKFDSVVVLDDCDEAAGELRDDVSAWLMQHHPEIRRDGRANDHPLVSAARLTQEDLVIVERRDAWRLTGAVVCFPSRWDLRSKLGATIDEIHGPVPHYGDTLADPTNALFERMTPERSFWRLNWTLLDDPTLFQPSAVRKPPAGSFDEWYVRVERQTLRRLARTGAIVFTVRTYVASAAELASRDEEFVDTLITNIRTAPDDMKEYKGWVGVAEHLASLKV